MDSRYIRQTQLKDFGPKAQEKLANSKVLVVGLGGLGIPVLQYLNAMGVGTIGLMDQDAVELHNLQRQVLYTEKDLGRMKLEVVHEKLTHQNSQTQFVLHDSFLVKSNALEVIKDYDVVIDATDNFPTRYLINDACVVLNKPFIYGALHGFEGHVSVFNYKDGPTYRCLYPDMPGDEEVPNCNENGVLGVVPGIIGTLQALETVKVLAEIGDVLSGKLLVFDGLNHQFAKIAFKTKVENKAIKELQESYDISDCDIVPTIDPESFLSVRKKDGQYLLIDVRTTQEFEENHLEDAINVPLDQIDSCASVLEKKNTVYVICQSGKRSKLAVKKLQAGFHNVSFYHISGGMNKMTSLCP
ncbi:HesA/MoeB/ThiF family protein [Flagellimonas nanhaiensis]|uniref:Molybdopterin-synthase adenylyltransferase n=1 Tax=Flagellimonas nanhaiensis TaxID=2292706 RepID=A0A371JUU8_9FLAO|nr:HesA/MoeB/ThiF family protein [Allomuricauda nanhaiensis]RDY61588.1 sulfurtransferase [Allomuricauda nanhaiensis]